MPSDHLIFCCRLLLLLSIFPSITVFSNKSVLHIRWPKNCSFSISPSNDYSGLISFRIDWFDLAVQGTLKSLLQHHNSKASVLWRSAFFSSFFLERLSWIIWTSQSNHKGPFKWKRRQKSQRRKRRCEERSRIWSNTEVSFADRGSGHRQRLAGSLPKLKRQGNGFLPRPSRSPGWYLHFSPVKFISDFWLPEP